MSDDLQARVAAMAATQRDRATAAREAYPTLAHLFDWAANSALGRPAWIRETATGASMGRRLPDRRNGRPLPRIPGVD